MDVGLNLLFLVPGETGGRETYIRRLLPAMRAADPSLRLTGFIGADGAPIDGLDRVVRLPVSARSRAGWAVGEAALVAGAAARAGVAVLHSPANFGPAWGPFARVLTVHDVGYRASGGAVAAFTHALVLPAARRAHRVITVSQVSGDELVRELGVPVSRVDVIPNGLAPPAEPRAPRGRRTVLAVATNLPHKDLATVVAAHARLPEPRPPLVLVGAGTETLPGGLGAIPQAELEARYAEAGVLVLPSRYEGFGFPVLEAFARGVPVVCSDLPVLREVAGDLARFVAPGDVEAFASAISSVLASPGDPSPLRARAAGFTWEAAASATLATYRRALAEAAGQRV